MWCPPTPPQDENDMYIDHALAFLYDTGAVIPEHNLPAIYVKKDYKRNRIDAGFFADGRRPLKLRKEESYYAPRSLFDRPSPAMAKFRRDLKLQRNRGVIRSMPNISIKQQVPLKPLAEPEGMAEWFIYEDMAILNVIQNLQGLPLNLMLLSPGHTPNWDLVADIVNQTSRTYRSPKQCRYRYEMVIVPREEGKLLESPKKQKKNKNPMKNPIKNNRSLRTSQIFASDNNNSFTKLTKLKFESIKNAMAKKPPQLKQVLVNSNMKNPKHLAVLTEFGVLAYDIPPSPFDIAIKRHERMSKDKQKPVSSQQQIDSAHQQLQQLNQRSPQLMSAVTQSLQQTISQNPLQQQPAILVQAAPNANVTASLVQQSALQQQPRSQQTMSLGQQGAQQVLKAIVASPQNNALLTGAMQNQQISQQNMMTTAVSVVLTANPTTLTTVPVSQSSQQIVSISSNVLGGITSSIVTQATQGSVVQALSSSSQLPQVVSMSQLTGTVLTSSTLPTSGLGQRTQRLVNPSTMQEVVLHQRAGAQNPTVVSVSSLGQGITQAQLQQAAVSGGYKLSIGTSQQVAGLVSKSIPVVGVNKNITSPQIQFFRQQPVRQQLKVLHAGPANQQQVVVQASVGQTMQVQSGQKMTVAGVSSAQTTPIVDVTQAGSATTNLTLQVTGVGGQQRTQFIKQVGKQNVGRQVTEADLHMIMAKRLQPQQSPKAQLISQTGQIFTPTSIHVQQSSGTGQQQITALVKTTGVPGGTTGTINMSTMSLSQVKGGQLKTTTVNANQRQQLTLQQQQQQLALQQRKGAQKISQIAQVPGKSTIPTQFIMQNSKNPQGIVTVQQIIRQQPGQIMLGQKINRVIPVSVSTQSNTRQIQVSFTTKFSSFNRFNNCILKVVTATSGAQVLRHGGTVTPNNMQGMQGTIKVTPTASQQAAIISALQSQSQRQNASPVRLQAGGSLVAVVQQGSADANASPGQIIAQPQQIQLTPQQTLQQQVIYVIFYLNYSFIKLSSFFAAATAIREQVEGLMSLKQIGFLTYRF